MVLLLMLVCCCGVVCGFVLRSGVLLVDSFRGNGESSMFTAYR